MYVITNVSDLSFLDSFFKNAFEKNFERAVSHLKLSLFHGRENRIFNLTMHSIVVMAINQTKSEIKCSI